MVRLSTDTAPSQDDNGGTLQVGTELIYEDTGKVVFWTGSAWAEVTAGQKLNQIVEVLLEIRDSLKRG